MIIKIESIYKSYSNSKLEGLGAETCGLIKEEGVKRKRLKVISTNAPFK
jgi:hypothetical protein